MQKIIDVFDGKRVKMQEYDVIIIGAGPAGCFSATELKRKNYSVCIMEKEAKGYRKVCGDGLAMVSMEILRLMDFPVERIPKKGAFPIKHYYYYVNDKLVKKEIAKLAYCLARNYTDELFQDYAVNDFGISIFYSSAVKNIVRVRNGFFVNGVFAEKVIIAAGANAKITLDGLPFLSIDSNKPLGLSCILKGSEIGQDGFFLFDYNQEYGGTYAWIFSLGKKLYNVGLWRKDNYNNYKCIKIQLINFIEKRSPEWIGDDYEIISPVRGAYMGIGKPLKSNEEGIYFVGDAANTSNKLDGEGISRAIISAKELVSTFGDAGAVLQK